MAEIPSFVKQAAYRAFHHHPEMRGAVLEAISRPQKLDVIIEHFDSVVGAYNSLSIDSVPGAHTNTLSLKRKTGNIALPTIEEVVTKCEDQSAHQFGTALHSMIGQMRRGEEAARHPDIDHSQLEPYLDYHLTPTLPSAKVVGTVFHLYEEFLRGDARFKGKFEPDEVVNVLIETLSLNQENPLYEQVADKTKLNWIEEWPGFSEEFRQSLGFK